MGEVLRFGRFELRPAERQLRIEGQPAALGARAFDLLLALVERHERVVSKGELLDLVWPGLVVEENNLQVQVGSLRKLLGANAIATVPGRGYRFTLALDGVPLAAVSRAPAAALDNLPAELPPLYGRDDDLRLALALLDAHRLVTIVGAGGIGKSRLAQAAAHAWRGRCADGVWWVELAPLADSGQLGAAVAQALALRLPGRGAPGDELVQALASRDALLVLDNCEHLAVGPFAQTLLGAAPNVRIVATSQRPLALADEQLLRLGALALPAADADAQEALASGALRLFVERVRRLDPRFAPGADDVAAAIDICRRLGGVALAIELAAARVPLLGLAGVRDRLGERLRVLAGGRGDAPPRHRTLHAALDWSHGLLDPDARAVLRRLAVFSGGFTVEAAQRVASDERLDEWAVLEQLGALADRSLLDTATDGRCTLLETTRAYAHERLIQAGETAAVGRRHADWYARHFQTLADALFAGTLTDDAYIAARAAEIDNLRAAIAASLGDGGDADTALRLLAHSAPLGFLLPGAADFIAWRARVAERLGAQASPAQRAWLAFVEVHFETSPGRLHFDRSRFEPTGDVRRDAFSLCMLSQVNPAADPRGHALMDRAMALERPDWPRWLRARRLFSGTMSQHPGHVGAAGTAALSALLDEFEAAGEGAGRSAFMLREMLASLLVDEQRFAEAAPALRALAERGRRERRDSHRMLSVLLDLGHALTELGRLDEARSALREAVEHARSTGYASWSVLPSAHHAAACGELQRAAHLLGIDEALRWREHKTPRGPRSRRIAQALRDRVVAAHGEAQLQAWLDQGARLDDAAALRLMLGD